MPSLTLRSGSSIRLKGQPRAIPDFLVIRCEGDRCWVRQQSWGPEAALAVKVNQIAIPESDDWLLSDLDESNVVSLALYRFRKQLRWRLGSIK
ncbi:hypothetical protein C7271_20050 [filamentous cyanobacterium CCP5]|nr:hypothetical protein C7271_20050 [filamentous cyanobacterium CCP5]